MWTSKTEQMESKIAALAVRNAVLLASRCHRRADAQKQVERNMQRELWLESDRQDGRGRVPGCARGRAVLCKRRRRRGDDRVRRERQCEPFELLTRTAERFETWPVK